MSRHVLLPLFAALLSLAAGQAVAQSSCTYPRAPDTIPDGRTASFEEMIEAQKAVRQFDADIAAFNTCLELELQSVLANPEVDPQRKDGLREMQVKRNNAAVDEATALAERFNEQLRAYNETQKAAKK